MSDEIIVGLEAEWSDLLGALAGASQKSPEAGLVHLPQRPLAVFAELEDVRERWAALRESNDVHRLASRFINARWALKDLLGHLASWASEFCQEVRVAAASGSFEYAIPYALSVADPNAWNAAQVEQRRETSLNLIFDEFDDATAALQEVVLQLPAAQLFAEREFPLAPSGDPRALWRGNCATLAWMKCIHDRYHFAQIERWMASQRAYESGQWT